PRPTWGRDPNVAPADGGLLAGRRLSAAPAVPLAGGGEFCAAAGRELLLHAGGPGDTRRVVAGGAGYRAGVDPGRRKRVHVDRGPSGRAGGDQRRARDRSPGGGAVYALGA